MKHKVICPYCNVQARLVDSIAIYKHRSYGMAWLCDQCQAYVGTHKRSNEPLGRLANAELRQWKVKAHAAFDPLWKTKKMSRNKAYAMLSELLGKKPKETHIGMFDVEDCKKTVEVCASR